jgi:hypothetical protein
VDSSSDTAGLFHRFWPAGRHPIVEKPEEVRQAARQQDEEATGTEVEGAQDAVVVDREMEDANDQQEHLIERYQQT